MFIAGPLPRSLRQRMEQAASVWTLGTVILIASVTSNAFAQTQIRTLNASQVDQIVDRLQAAVQNYVFPDIATKLEQQIKNHREQYRTITDPTKLADQLTADMRAVGHDHHLAVTFGEELGVQKAPTPEEVQHAHAFDRANGYGLRSARRLPGNVGYIDIAYFSPDSDAGAAIAAAMQMVSGTDSLIIDLRRNGGGSGPTMNTLASYFFNDVTQLSGVVEKVDGKTQERQHWSMPFVQGPRYLNKPLFILTSRHTHSAAEVLAYDLKNAHLAVLVGDRTSGDATSATGEISLGFGFSTFIANGQMVSPVTHGNYIGVGVQPDVQTESPETLTTAYTLALKAAIPSLDSDDLKKEWAQALQNPKAALLQEIDGFSQD
jgi:Peptidase family S41/N-terminal domain of Peptidase_S41 in eukaryotic IRBP